MAVTPTEASVEELDQLLNSFPRSDADRDKFLRYQHVLYQQRLEGALAKLTQEITEARLRGEGWLLIAETKGSRLVNVRASFRQSGVIRAKNCGVVYRPVIYSRDPGVVEAFYQTVKVEPNWETVVIMDEEELSRNYGSKFYLQLLLP